MKKIIFTSIFTLSTSLFANVAIKSIDIYKNQTFVKQELSLDKKSENLIENIRFDDIRFSIDGNCSITNTKIFKDNKSIDILSKNIESLKEKISLKDNEKKSLTNSLVSLENVSYSNNAVSLNNIKDVNNFVKNELKIGYDKLYFLEKEIYNLNLELNQLTNKKNTQKYSKIQYDAKCEDGSKLYIIYPMYSLEKNGFYEVNANSKENIVEIKNSYFLTQRSGYDFNNIDINLYTFNFTNSLEPILFSPKYLNIYKKNNKYFFDKAPSFKSKMVSMDSKRIIKSKYSYHETQTKSFFKASNVSLNTGIKKELTFSKDKYKTENSIEIDGYGYAKPFYKVKFKSDKLYGVQSAKLFLDDIFVSNYFQKELKKGENNYIYFGEDRLIDIKKDLIKDMSEEPIFSLSKLKTEKIWKYTIKNNHKVEKMITLVERLPISKHEDIKVNLLSKNKYSKKEDNGKVSYSFTLKPNEVKILEFGYEVEKPYEK